MIQLTSAYSTDLRRYQPAAILLWTLLILAMYGVDTYKRLESTKKMALDQARAYINKDLALRTWAADQGGIYVPVSKTVLPNPLPSSNEYTYCFSAIRITFSVVYFQPI